MAPIPYTRPVGARRHAILIGSWTFAENSSEDDLEWERLPYVPERVEAMARALRKFGYKCDISSAPAIRDAVFAAARQLTSDDQLIVHVIGHGEISDKGRLILIDRIGGRDRANDIGEWIRCFAEEPQFPSTLFLVDTCHAGTAARQAWQLLDTDSSGRTWIVSACGASDQAFNGRFTEAAINVLENYATDRLAFGAGEEHISLSVVAREISSELRALVGRDLAPYQEVVGSLLDITSPPITTPFFPNPWFDAKAMPSNQSAVALSAGIDESLDVAHFTGLASGLGDIAADGAGCFRGRVHELGALVDWMGTADDRPLWVVTGSPGVGKSALLGVVVCAAHPLLRDRTHNIWSQAQRVPGRRTQFSAVHARQRSVREIIAAIARQLGYSKSGHEIYTVAELISSMCDADHPPVVVVDSLDEAEDHRAVTAALQQIAAKSRPAGGPICKLLVGTRPWEEVQPLLEDASARASVTDLDQVNLGTLREDLEDYVSSLLRRHKPYDHKDFVAARQLFAVAVASELTDRSRRTGEGSWGEFLVAGLYAHHFLSTDLPIKDAKEAEKRGSCVPHTLPALLDLDLARRPDADHIRAVLVALAHSRGAGMPVQILRRAAGAFLPGRRPIDRHEVTTALEAAAFYLRRSTDTDGTTLFRLFHQGLADHLKNDPGSLFAALVAPLENRLGETRRWDLAEPYLLRHAAQHASDSYTCSGSSDQASIMDVNPLASDEEFAVHADPAECGYSPYSWLTFDKWAQASVMSRERRRHALALEALRNDDAGAAYRLVHPPGQSPSDWYPVRTVPGATAALSFNELQSWVISRSDGGLEIVPWDEKRRTVYIQAEADAVSAVAVGRVADQKALVFGTISGQVGICLVDSAMMLMAPVSAHDGAGVVDIRHVELAGRSAVLSRGTDGQVRLTSTASGAEVVECGIWGEPPVPERPIRVLLCVDGMDVQVTADGEAPDELVVRDFIRDAILFRFSVGAHIRAVIPASAAHFVAMTDDGAVCFRHSAPPREASPKRRTTHAKVLIAGGFGTGKSTLVSAISEINPLTTEGIMTSAGVAVDDNKLVPGKLTVTTGIDFGRFSIDRELILYLFGVAGPTRFWYNWDQTARGCIAALLLVDSRRVADGFAQIDYFEQRQLPYIVGINCFDGLQHHAADAVREALHIAEDVPVVALDARSRESVKDVLITVIEYVRTLRRSGATPPVPAQRDGTTDLMNVVSPPLDIGLRVSGAWQSRRKAPTTVRDVRPRAGQD